MNGADAIRSRLTEIASEFSGFSHSELAPDKTLLELGFDSLFLTQLATAFQKEFGVKLTFRQLICDYPTLNKIANYINDELPDTSTPIKMKTPESDVAEINQPEERSAPSDFAGIDAIADKSALAKIFSDQISLMRRQLEMLRGEADPTTGPRLQTGLILSAVAKDEDTVLAVDAVETGDELPAGFGPQVGGNTSSDVLTQNQKAHIDRLVARYNARTGESKKLTQANRAHHADPRTAAGFNPLWKELVYPIVVKKSLGARLWDVDNNEYIDLLNGFGPNFFGHRAEFITDALRAQLDTGYEIGPQTPRAGDAAKLLCEITGMDRVSWVNTGSEAVQAAIRIARTVTGRDKFVVFNGDYHGNFDEVLVRGVARPSGGAKTVPMAPGIPSDSVSNIIVCEYGEKSALDIIEQSATDIAAVLVEPVQSRRPDFRPKEFLQNLRKLTADNEIALIFDEVVTGFRICPGGAQEYFDVSADLATYGKIIGGGMPIGVVAGRSEFMDTFDGGMWRYGDDSVPSAGVTFFAGTFVRHPMAIAAAHASLQYIQNAGPGLQQRINALAERLATELNEFFDEHGVEIFVAQFASQLFFRVIDKSELTTLFFYHLRDRGIHILEHFPSYMTAAHTDEDVDAVIAAAKDSIFEMQADGVIRSPSAAVASVWRRKIPLTRGQQEIWLASQMSAKASCAFNESDSIIIDGPLNESAFCSAVDDTLVENEIFSVTISDDGQFQTFGGKSPPTTNVVDVSLYSEAVRDEKLSALFRQHALKEFDLSTGPIVRTMLIKISADRHVFVIYCHHIAFDGYSASLVINEIANRYKAIIDKKPFRSELVPYSVFASTHIPNKDSIQYWRDQFKTGAPAALELPVDRPRGAVRSYGGATTHRAVATELYAGVKTAARALGVSHASILLSAYSALLSRLTGQEDMIVGVPAAGQAFAEIETVGYCVNILPVRLQPLFERNFAEFVRSAQSLTAAAFEHQNVSIGELCDELGVRRDPARSALIDAVFNYSRYFSDIEISGCRISARENRRYAVHYDLFFNIHDSGDRFVIDLDYSSELFDADTIDRWIDHFLALLADIVANADKSIGDLSLVLAKPVHSAPPKSDKV